ASKLLKALLAEGPSLFGIAGPQEAASCIDRAPAAVPRAQELAYAAQKVADLLVGPREDLALGVHEYVAQIDSPWTVTVRSQTCRSDVVEEPRSVQVAGRDPPLSVTPDESPELVDLSVNLVAPP